MRSADSVLETLRRGSPEQSFRESTVRLESAIRSGQGHIVVLGDSQHEAAMFVDSVVARASGYDVVQISIRRIDETLAADAIDRPALVVVHDADGASAADLERVRDAAELSLHAVQHVRLLLVGSAKLEGTLALPDARAFNSRVGAHVRLVRKTSHKHAVPLIRRAVPRRWALITSAVTGCAALVCVTVADLSQPNQANSMLARTAGELAKLGEGMSAVLADVGIRSGAGSRLVASAGDGVLSILEPVAPSAVRAISAASEKPSRQSAGRAPKSTFGSFVQNTAHAAAHTPKTAVAPQIAKSSRPGVRAAAPSVERAAKAPAAPAPKRGFLSSITRLFIGDSSGGRVVETKGAVVETALMATSARTRPSATPAGERYVLQLGSFSHAQGAFELKSSLKNHFDVLAVARFDPPAGPVFAVRVFDLDGRPSQVAINSTLRSE